jgi:hypothetical protein
MVDGFRQFEADRAPIEPPQEEPTPCIEFPFPPPFFLPLFPRH